MLDREQLVAEISREVITRLQAHLASRSQGHPARALGSPAIAAGKDGVFSTVAAAADAQRKVAALSLEDRGRMISIIRRICEERKHELAKMELDESGLGRLDHKIQKLEIVKNVLGVEAMRSDARTDASGLCLIERAPWGVIGMVLPATHTVPTMASNAIYVLAAGNTAIFSPHPAGAKVAAYALALFNHEIQRELKIANVITTVAEPSIRTAEEIFKHPNVALLC